MKPFIFLIHIALIFYCQGQILTNRDSNQNEPAPTENGNKKKVEVELHTRVDTTKSDIKEIAQLWISYLNSEPDKISDNPYWNEEEKRKYKDFDLSRGFMYQFPSEMLLNYFKPKILAIEPEGDVYGIRTVYWAEGLEGIYRKSNPWCIQKVYAIKENNEWKLKNSLPIVTAHWSQKTVGKIRFLFPPDHRFNKKQAKKANEFCLQLSREFGFPDWEPFDFYITSSGDELGRLLNFEFFFAGYTTGVGLNEHRILLSGLGSEYYPHEFIHLILPVYDRHSFVEEGFATWKGGQGGMTFEESARLLANELAKNDTVRFSDVLNKQWGWQFSAFYTSGAVLCNAAYERGGAKLVNDFLKAPNDDAQLVDYICHLFKINKKDIDMFWRNEVLKYGSR